MGRGQGKESGNGYSSMRKKERKRREERERQWKWSSRIDERKKRERRESKQEKVRTTRRSKAGKYGWPQDSWEPQHGSFARLNPYDRMWRLWKLSKSKTFLDVQMHNECELFLALHCVTPPQPGFWICTLSLCVAITSGNAGWNTGSALRLWCVRVCSVLSVDAEFSALIEIQWLDYGKQGLDVFIEALNQYIFI